MNDYINIFNYYAYGEDVWIVIGLGKYDKVELIINCKFDYMGSYRNFNDWDIKLNQLPHH